MMKRQMNDEKSPQSSPMHIECNAVECCWNFVDGSGEWDVHRCRKPTMTLDEYGHCTDYAVTD